MHNVSRRALFLSFLKELVLNRIRIDSHLFFKLKKLISDQSLKSKHYFSVRLGNSCSLTLRPLLLYSSTFLSPCLLIRMAWLVIFDCLVNWRHGAATPPPSCRSFSCGMSTTCPELIYFHLSIAIDNIKFITRVTGDDKYHVHFIAVAILIAK